MRFTLTFEYEVADENEAREIRDVVSPAVHDPYMFDHLPDNWHYSFKKENE